MIRLTSFPLALFIASLAGGVGCTDPNPTFVFDAAPADAPREGGGGGAGGGTAGAGGAAGAAGARIYGS